MTREQAKIFLKLSKYDLGIINPGYADNYEILKAFADGSKVEGLCEESGKWEELDNPPFRDFGLIFEYRVKPNKEQILSKTETVESLDGHELSDAEKGVIRILRRCNVETMWNCPFVYLERQDKLSTCDAGVLFKFESGAKASEFGDLADDAIAEAEERREKGEPSW